MNTIRIARALGAADVISVRRDSLLRGMVLVPLGLALAARWLLPVLAARVGTLLGFDLLPWYPAFMGYALLLLPPAICGMVVGFLLLDQRDDRTLAALQVTPLPLVGYLIYRLAAPLLLSVAMTVVALPLAGLAHLSVPELLLVALAAAPLAPMTALFLAAFAANKVQGFALQKVLGLFLVAPVFVAFAPLPWSLLIGIVPTYWPAILFWSLQAGQPPNWPALVLGLAYQGLLLVLLLIRFTRAA